MSPQRSLNNDVLIIGGGPAGLAAAFYLLRQGIPAIIIGDQLGGKAGWAYNRTGIEEGLELPETLFVHVLTSYTATHGLQRVDDLVTRLTVADGRFGVETKLGHRLTVPAVILTTGVTPVGLDVPGPWYGLEHGISYSSVAHAQLADGCRVAVVGSTERALRSAAGLVRVAKQLYFITPNTEQLPNDLLAMIKAQPNVVVLEGYTINPAEQVLVALGAGARAGMSAYAYLVTQRLLTG